MLRMDNTNDSYSSCFVLCEIRFEPSNFFLGHQNFLLACMMRLSMSASSVQSELILDPSRYGNRVQKSMNPSPSLV